MLAADVEYLAEDRLAPLWPGLAIALTVWALNALADALRDGLEVRSREVPEAALAEAPARLEVAA
jgi:ABC-type dipeptide/oligopeptide/nickel transport system permease subunit